MQVVDELIGKYLTIFFETFPNCFCNDWLWIWENRPFLFFQEYCIVNYHERHYYLPHKSSLIACSIGRMSSALMQFLCSIGKNWPSYALNLCSIDFSYALSSQLIPLFSQLTTVVSYSVLLYNLTLKVLLFIAFSMWLCLQKTKSNKLIEIALNNKKNWRRILRISVVFFIFRWRRWTASSFLTNEEVAEINGYIRRTYY